MFKRVILFDDVWRSVSGFRARAIVLLVDYLNKKLGVSTVYFQQLVAGDMGRLLRVAKALQDSRILGEWYAPFQFPDEPRFLQYVAQVLDKDGTSVLVYTGGSDTDSPFTALVSALAEAIERHIWFFSSDQYSNKKTLLLSDLLMSGLRLNSGSFATSAESEKFTCVEGYCWSFKKKQHVPLQLISGLAVENEPLLREQNTTGLATWPDRAGALCHGLLELIERDAYMNMWLNQLTLPRYEFNEEILQENGLGKLIQTCNKYHLYPHFIKLLTDAPTFAMCVVVEDKTGNGPRMALGLKAGPLLSKVAKGALLEALRVRRYIRHLVKNDAGKVEEVANQEVTNIGHGDRLLYWMNKNNEKKLDFLIKGNLVEAGHEEWEDDNIVKHFNRLVEWCRKKNYSCVSVSHTGAGKNVTPWYIEAVVVPELQSMHLFEKNAHINEFRRKEVPALFGYGVIEEPFLDAPHPFM